MIDSLPNTSTTADDFGTIGNSPLYAENKKRKLDVQVHVIQTIIALLERDVPNSITDNIALNHCGVRLQAMKDQRIAFYDTSFYRSVHSFFVNFVEAFQSGRVGETDVPAEVIERRFLYRELLAELEDFVYDL